MRVCRWTLGRGLVQRETPRERATQSPVALNPNFMADDCKIVGAVRDKGFVVLSQADARSYKTYCRRSLSFFGPARARRVVLLL